MESLYQKAFSVISSYYYFYWMQFLFDLLHLTLLCSVIALSSQLHTLHFPLTIGTLFKSNENPVFFMCLIFVNFPWFWVKNFMFTTTPLCDTYNYFLNQARGVDALIQYHTLHYVTWCWKQDPCFLNCKDIRHPPSPSSRILMHLPNSRWNGFWHGCQFLYPLQAVGEKQ